MSSVGYNKIFFNLGPTGDPSGIGDLINRATAAKIPVFLATTDSMSGLFDLQVAAQQSGVAHVGNYRSTGYYNPRSGKRSFDPGQEGFVHLEVPNYNVSPEIAAVENWVLHKELIPSELDPAITWISTINEVRGYLGWGQEGSPPDSWDQPIPGFTGWADWLGAFAVETAKLALEDGYKWTAFGWATGNPEEGSHEQPNMIEFLKLCAQHPDRLGFNIHEYSLDPSDIWAGDGRLIGRFADINAAADGAGLARPTIHITEWGWSERSSPSRDQAMQDIDQVAELYAQHPNVKGAATWTLISGWGDLHKKINKLIDPVADLTVSKTYPITETPPDPPDQPRGKPRVDYRRVVWVINADVDLTRYLQIAERAFLSANTLGFSFDDGGIGDLSDKTVVILGDKIDPVVLADWYKIHYPTTKLQFVTLEGQPVALTPFRFEAWPTVSKVITQAFGANPKFYGQYDLPGHDGIDFRSAVGSPIFAVAGGVVSDVHTNPDDHNYGVFVRVKHVDGYETTYAHMQRVDVSVGQQVGAGQRLGLSGNTGNSSGPHLHLTLKNDRACVGCPLYIGYRANIVDPTPFVDAFNLEPSTLPPDSERGDPRVQYARSYDVFPSLDRSDPDILKQYLQIAATVYPRRGTLGGSYDDSGIGDLDVRHAVCWGIAPDRQPVFVDWYNQHYAGVLTAFEPLPNVDPPIVNPKTRIGLHASADPGKFHGGAAELTEFKTLGGNFGENSVFKVLSAHDPSDIARIAQDTQGAAFVVRAFLSMEKRQISPQQFVNDTINDVQRTLQALQGRDVVIELHNEPNLSAEGLKIDGQGSWDSAQGFNDWYMDVLRLYRQSLPGQRFIFPGLSPGWGFEQSDVKRIDSMQFLQACLPAIYASDGVGLHAYWSSQWAMQRTLDQLDDHLGLMSSLIPVWITEASINDNPAVYSAQEYADQYVEFWQTMQQRPQVKGVMYFVGSASNPSFAGESWIVNGKSRGIAESMS